MTADTATWVESNQLDLRASLDDLRNRLEQYASRSRSGRAADTLPEGLPPQGTTRHAAAPSALEVLCTTFGLSPFERDLLLLCAGIELDSSFSALCAEAHGDPARPFPTFSLALAALHMPHWDALTSERPLRHWRLIDIVNQPGTPLTTNPLRIDERILHYLAGAHHMDERLVGLIEPAAGTADLVPSHLAVATQFGHIWAQAQEPVPLIQLCGGDELSKRAIAAAGCHRAGLHLFSLPADVIPTNAAEVEGLVRLWDREAALTSSALYVDADMVDPADGAAVATVTRLLERVCGPVLLGARDRWKPLRRPIVRLEIRKPTTGEQRSVWQTTLAHRGINLNGHVDGLVAQFDLSLPAIRASVDAVTSPEASSETIVDELWDAGRSQARPQLDTLAQRIEPVARWDDLVLPAAQRGVLREIAAHVAYRHTVYDTWGFGAVSSRGLGISALFAGASGTGKTMAAEVLANELRLDLYRIDLSSVVSKYIGETEKNLRRVFDAAEDGGAILFFDEADALFGKRSEVKDSHDRYANIEINYLLQRMESYRGIAVLATNMKGSLDPAFLRRIRFIVNFPFPDVAQRAEIWQRVFPAMTPTDGLDTYKLARLNLAGGNIRNIALTGAFLAAAAGEPVRMTHLAEAARAEYAKMERPLTEAEIGGWQ